MASTASFLSRAMRPLFGRAWKPLNFPSEGFVRIPADQKVEEETLPDYVASRYYPVRIGEILQNRYQVVGKLGYGATSTVWLARDLGGSRHVALKLFIHSESMRRELNNELNVYKRVESTPKKHPGRSAIRSLLDSFNVNGPKGPHRCLVHPPLWEKCRVAHTDIKEANILLGADEAVLRDLEKEELDDPCPRKELDGGKIYLSRELNLPEDYGAPVLCDLGSAVPLDNGVEHREDIQPNVYRAPEIILDIPWTYSVDIWNVGCMGEHLFTGHDTELETYRGRAHLAEMIALLGPPPPSLLAQANLRSKFFSDAGVFCGGIPLPESRPFEHRETSLREKEEEEDGACFLRFMRRMLQWEPEERSSAGELAEDEWIVKHTTDT